jgi:CheY-like chemotaxis protein
LERRRVACSKILVVEDDPIVLMGISESIKDAGLAVLEAETADAALTILSANIEDVTVILSDVEMPGKLDGVALAALVRDQWPAISVVLTSGQAASTLATLPAEILFVPKPYSPATVVALIARLAKPRVGKLS